MDWLRRRFAAHDSPLAAWAQGRTWWWYLPLGVHALWLLIASLGDVDRASWFSAIDLGIHEAGHLLTRPLPDLVTAAAGSGAQVAAPVVAGWLLLRRPDWIGGAFCCTWLGVSLLEVGRYVADARAQALPLVTVGGGDAIHDFHFILGELGLLDADQVLAGLMRGAGLAALLLGAVATCWITWVVRCAARAAAPADTRP